MDPERIAEIIAGLAGPDATVVTDQDIAAGLASIREQATELATAPVTPESVAGLETLVNQRKALMAAQSARTAGAALADQHAAALAELDGRHDPSRDHVQQDQDAAPIPPAGAGAPEGTRADERAPEGEEDADKAKKGDGSKAARGRKPRELGDLNKDDKPEASQFGGVVTAVTKVQGSVPGMSPGQELGNHANLIRAFREKANALSGTAAAGRHDVARMEFSYPPERVLEGVSEAANMAKIEAARALTALTATAPTPGGLCLPLEVRYDIETIGVTDRPIKAALSAFQVERGGLQYRAPFDALVMGEGLGVWTQDDDVADPLVPKTCLAVECPGVLEASIYSTYLCLEFSNMTARFDNEWVDATTQSSMVAWARFAENQLLSRLASGSKIILGDHVLGAVRDVLINFDRIAAYYRNRHRLNDEIALHMLAPRWLIDLLRADVAMQMPSASMDDQFNVARGIIERWLGTRNINVSWHLDGLAGATVSGITYPDQFYADLVAGNGVPAFPVAVDTLLWREGDWLFLDGGTLDLGLVRDSTLNLRNRYQTFVETFEGAAFIGKECLRLILPIIPSGASTGTIDPALIDPTLPVPGP